MFSPPPEVAAARGRVAALSRSRTSDDPEYIDARRDLKTETLSRAAKNIVAKSNEFPPLTPAQRDAILAAFAGFREGVKV